MRRARSFPSLGLSSDVQDENPGRPPVHASEAAAACTGTAERCRLAGGEFSSAQILKELQRLTLEVQQVRAEVQRVQIGQAEVCAEMHAELEKNLHAVESQLRTQCLGTAARLVQLEQNRPRVARHPHETRQYNPKRLLAASKLRVSSIEDQVHLVDAAAGFVPAATLSCLQAVCDAAAGRTFAVPGQVHEDQESESHDAPALERAKRASLMIKASVGHTGAMRAMCSLEHCKLTLSNDQRLPQDESVVVEVQLKELGVGLRQGLANMFTVVTVRDNKMASDDICCFANNQAERDEWISAFRRMGVPVFDVSQGTENAKELSPEAVISFQVCQYLSRLVTRIQRIPSSGGSAGTVNQAHTGRKQVRFERECVVYCHTEFSILYNCVDERGRWIWQSAAALSCASFVGV